MTEKNEVTFSEPVRLPDGSGVMTGTFPLRKDHWIYAEGHEDEPAALRVGIGPEREKLRQIIQEATRYAVRRATMNGAEKDFDPDALVQNMVVGLLGPNVVTSEKSKAVDPIIRKANENHRNKVAKSLAAAIAELAPHRAHTFTQFFQDLREIADRMLSAEKAVEG